MGRGLNQASYDFVTLTEGGIVLGLVRCPFGFAYQLTRVYCIVAVGVGVGVASVVSIVFSSNTSNRTTRTTTIVKLLTML